MFVPSVAAGLARFGASEIEFFFFGAVSSLLLFFIFGLLRDGPASASASAREPRALAFAAAGVLVFDGPVGRVGLILGS